MKIPMKVKSGAVAYTAFKLITRPVRKVEGYIRTTHHHYAKMIYRTWVEKHWSDLSLEDQISACWRGQIERFAVPEKDRWIYDIVREIDRFSYDNRDLQVMQRLLDLKVLLPKVLWNNLQRIIKYAEDHSSEWGKYYVPSIPEDHPNNLKK